MVSIFCLEGNGEGGVGGGGDNILGVDIVHMYSKWDVYEARLKLPTLYNRSCLVWFIIFVRVPPGMRRFM